VRGNWSCQVQPTLDGIAWLEREGIVYDWLVTLTAQDYPTKPLAESEQLYAESRADGFLRHWDVESPASPWPLHKPRRRYWYQYLRLDDSAMRWLRAAKVVSHLVPGTFVSLYYGPYVGARAWRTPWKNGFRCYGGWAWGALRREAAGYVVDYLDANPELVAFYRRVMSPEESILQTVLCNSGRFTLVDDDLRYLDYAGSKTGSPRVITVEDVPRLAAGPWCFARKFDLSVDRQVLDRIDAELLGTAR
jgi:hypothetical protein